MIFIEIPTSEVWFVLRDSTLHASFIHLGHYKAFRFRHSLVALIFFLNQDREEIDLPKHLEKQKKKTHQLLYPYSWGWRRGYRGIFIFLILILHVIFYTADLTI